MPFDKTKPYAESRDERGFVAFIQDDKHYNALGDEVTPDGKKIIKAVPKKEVLQQQSKAVDAQLDAQLS
jgi:hypothetical protein